MITTIENKLRRLGPYPSLFVVALPFCLVEPSKLIAVAVLGKGHWITGSAMIVAAYAASVLLIERLFVITKPQLLKLRWFARFWAVVVMMRLKIVARASRGTAAVPARVLVARHRRPRRTNADAAREQTRE
jgi:hypothetical protein